MKFNKLSEGAAKYARANGILVFSLGTKQKKWVKSLRSGDYTKAIGNLCSHSKNGSKFHCCLGVACDISNLCKVDITENDAQYGLEPINKSGTIRAFKSELFDGENTSLPNSVIDGYRFHGEMGEFDSSWNDDFYSEDKFEGKKSKYIDEVKKYVKKFGTHYETYTDLAEMNDGVGSSKAQTHSQIADFVEAYPQAIFEQAM
jgi:hypothetical protein